LSKEHGYRIILASNNCFLEADSFHVAPQIRATNKKIRRLIITIILLIITIIMIIIGIAIKQ
jgi:hypothetical protein